jgi:hypothetical protein
MSTPEILALSNAKESKEAFEKANAEYLATKEKAKSDQEVALKAWFEARETQLAEVIKIRNQTKEDLDTLNLEIRRIKALKPQSDVFHGPIGVGVLIRKMVADGATNPEILKQIAVDYPDNATTDGTLRWYRNQIKKENEKAKQ